MIIVGAGGEGQGPLMSDLGIICALFGYLLRLSDNADIMLGYNIARPLRAFTLRLVMLIW